MPDSVWTNNWQGVKNALLCGFIREGWSTVRDEDGNLMARYLGATPIGTFSNINSGSSTEPVLIFGTGSTPPAVTDIKLDNKWNSGISRVAIVNGTISYDDSTHTASRTVKATIQNTSAGTVTVREWGIVGRASRGANNNYYGDVLLFRALLEEPVVLNQYESATLSVSISVQVTDPA